jgi:hypothetical protein
MYLSRVQYPADGNTATFSVPFPYIAKAYVKVSVDGVATTAFTWDSPSVIRITPTPPSGSVVDVRRNTRQTERLVNFQDGSILTEEQLDMDSDQLFHISQEVVDQMESRLGVETNGQVDGKGSRLENLADPRNAQDAVTLSYLQASFAPAMEDLRTQAGNSASAAASSANTAQQGAATATAKEQAASTSATTAASSEAQALAYRDDAHASADRASAAATAVLKPWTANGSNISYNSGNVGIGSDTPGSKLDIVGTSGSILARWMSGGTAGAVTVIDASGRIDVAAQNAAGTTDAKIITFSTTPSGSASAVERLRLDASGNLSLGLTSASGYRMVIGGASVKTLFVTTDVSTATMVSDGALALGTLGSNALSLSTNGAARLTIDAAGAVSIPGALSAPAMADTSLINGIRLGYRNIPQVAQSAAYTLALSDVGKSVDTSAGVTVPPNSTVAFAIGDTLSITNTSAASITITQGTGVTMRQAGTTNTGNRTVAAYGLVTLRKVGADLWFIAGSGLS